MYSIPRLLLLTLIATPVLAVNASAQNIFDVEHARAMYRAGVATRYDMEQLRKYGRPSGYYPQYGPPRPRRIDLRRVWWERRYD